VQPSDLPSAWRTRAADLRLHDATGAATAYERAADELERAQRAAAVEALTLQQAATESGYSIDHIGRLVADGNIENIGRKGAPRIRRGDLPRKAIEPQLTRRQVARAVVHRGGGR